MWKKCIAVVVVTILFFSSGGEYVFAQPSCDTCSRAPNDLQTYYKVMGELISVIPTSPSEDIEDTSELGKIAIGSLAAMDAAVTTSFMSLVLPVQTVTDSF